MTIGKSQLVIYLPRKTISERLTINEAGRQWLLIDPAKLEVSAVNDHTITAIHNETKQLFFFNPSAVMVMRKEIPYFKDAYKSKSNPYRKRLLTSIFKTMNFLLGLLVDSGHSSQQIINVYWVRVITDSKDPLLETSERVSLLSDSPLVDDLLFDFSSPTGKEPDLGLIPIGRSNSSKEVKNDQSAIAGMIIFLFCLLLFIFFMAN